MEGVAKAVLRLPFLAKAKAEQDAQKTAENEQLIQEIRIVCDKIQSTEMKFQMICDDDLVESCIYELEALHAKYRFLLRQAKQQGVTNTPFLPEEACKIPVIAKP